MVKRVVYWKWQKEEKVIFSIIRVTGLKIHNHHGIHRKRRLSHYGIIHVAGYELENFSKCHVLSSRWLRNVVFDRSLENISELHADIEEASDINAADWNKQIYALDTHRAQGMNTLFAQYYVLYAFPFNCMGNRVRSYAKSDWILYSNKTRFIVFVNKSKVKTYFLCQF